MESLGYARVSTKAQSPALRIEALKSAGCSKAYADHGASGARASRPQLDKLLDQLREGDEVVVWKLERLGRNTRNLFGIASPATCAHMAECV